MWNGPFSDSGIYNWAIFNALIIRRLVKVAGNLSSNWTSIGFLTESLLHWDCLIALRYGKTIIYLKKSNVSLSLNNFNINTKFMLHFLEEKWAEHYTLCLTSRLLWAIKLLILIIVEPSLHRKRNFEILVPEIKTRNSAAGVAQSV